MRFEEIGERSVADDRLRDRYLEAVAPSGGPGDGAYYWHELTGTEVTTTDGEVLGTVEDVFRAGGGEILVVRGGRRGEVLVPAVHGIVVDLAPREGRIVVDRDALGLDEEPRPRKPRGRRTRRALAAGPTDADRGIGHRGVGARGSEAVTLRIDVVTLFPELFPGRSPRASPAAPSNAAWSRCRPTTCVDWGLGRHRSVDDYPYGGGAGMVLRPEPIADALRALATPQSTRILLDPGGRPFDQALARDLAAREHLVLVAPRYEGVDDRVRSLMDLEVSIGDYILSGGELPALVVIDAVIRLVPGAIDEASTLEESFGEGLLEYPQYTRPAEFEGRAVPRVLLSGHHAEVARWRHEQAVERTRRNRPDLLETDDAGFRIARRLRPAILRHRPQAPRPVSVCP